MLLKRALSIRQQHSGEEDEEALHVGNDLAAVYNSQKHFAQSEDRLLQLLARTEAVYAANANDHAPSHKAVLHHNIGNSCHWQGRCEDALCWYNAALAHWTEYGISNHPGHADT